MRPDKDRSHIRCCNVASRRSIKSPANLGPIRRKIIGLVGLPGSGKSTVASILQSHNLPVIVMGDVVRNEAAARGIRPTLENMKELMMRLREEKGGAAVAELCISLIGGIGSRTVVVDGMRSLVEVQRFQSYAPLSLIGIFSPQWLRFKRLRERRRSDAPKSRADLARRDMAEIEVGVGAAFALADYMLINDGTVNELKVALRMILPRIR